MKISHKWCHDIKEPPTEKGEIKEQETNYYKESNKKTLTPQYNW